MVNLARLLLWGGYNAAGDLMVTFRLTEDQTYADVEDDEITLAGVVEVGLLHPLELSDEARLAWAELFSDYELVSPFPQLGREIYRLREEEIRATEITRFTDTGVPAIALVRILEGRGWQRGQVDKDTLMFYGHVKSFPRVGVTAKIEYDGIEVNLYQAISPKILGCFFVPGLYDSAEQVQPEAALPLGQVDPVVVSEVLRDLTTVSGRAKQ